MERLIQSLYIFHLTVGEASAVMRRFYSNDPTRNLYSSSTAPRTRVECLAWANKYSEPTGCIHFDRNTGQCSIYNTMMPHYIFRAFNMSSTAGKAYYVDGGCIPTCKRPAPYAIHEKPSEFPANLFVYMPLVGDSGLTLNIHYYLNPSLTAHNLGLTLDVWDQQFLDGSYPVWVYDEGPCLWERITPKTFSSLSLFAWVFIEMNSETKHHPVLGMVQYGDWGAATVLGAGNVNMRGRISFSYSASTGQYLVLKSDDEVTKRGKWQHIGGTYDANTGIAHIYHNGESIKSENFGTGKSTKALDVMMILYSKKMDQTVELLEDSFCQGCAAIHQEIYDRSLTGDEVKQIYDRYSCEVSEETCPSN